MIKLDHQNVGRLIWLTSVIFPETLKGLIIVIWQLYDYQHSTFLHTAITLPFCYHFPFFFFCVQFRTMDHYLKVVTWMLPCHQWHTQLLIIPVQKQRALILYQTDTRLSTGTQCLHNGKLLSFIIDRAEKVSVDYNRFSSEGDLLMHINWHYSVWGLR